MFKALRTKIESEHGQTSNSSSPKNNRRTIPQDLSVEANLHIPSKPICQGSSLIAKEEPPKTVICYASNPLVKSNENNIETIHNEHTQSIKTAKDDEASEMLPNLTDGQTGDSSVKPGSNHDVEYFQSQILKLKEQLSIAIREKDDVDDQNAQLYQLIEKLRRNLETEQVARSNLEKRLSENEKQSKVKTDDNNSTRSIGLNKSFNPDAVSASAPDVPNDVGALRNEVAELKEQLVKKDRLLKIRQQNLLDIKKTLQKEISDHARTQEDLSRLRKQPHSSNHQNSNHQQTSHRDKGTTKSHNGSNQVDQPPNV